MRSNILLKTPSKRESLVDEPVWKGLVEKQLGLIKQAVSKGNFKNKVVMSYETVINNGKKMVMVDIIEVEAVQKGKAYPRLVV